MLTRLKREEIRKQIRSLKRQTVRLAKSIEHVAPDASQELDDMELVFDTAEVALEIDWHSRHDERHQ